MARSRRSSTVDEIAKYREALQDGNPAELWEARGEELWKKPRGPKKVSLREAATSGMGPGVVKGAYAQLPRYFADAERVMDLETRLVWCMVNAAGHVRGRRRRRTRSAAATSASPTWRRWSRTSRPQSRGVKMNVALDDPHVNARCIALGEKMFFFRGGTHDFACATCHAEDGKRIRLQDLPNLTKAEGAQKAYTTWPAYRVSQGELRTFQWRLNDCFRQQRFPGARVRLGRVDRADDVPGAATRTAPRSTRPRSSADGGRRRCDATSYRARVIAGAAALARRAARLRDRARATREVTREGARR